jgi:hypothetical protein
MHSGVVAIVAATTVETAVNFMVVLGVGLIQGTKSKVVSGQSLSICGCQQLDYLSSLIICPGQS